MSNKKYCYRSTAWRTRHKSIMKLIKNVLEKTLKSQAGEEEDGMSGAQRAGESFFFFLHILGSVDMTRLVTALRMSNVQSRWFIVIKGLVHLCAQHDRITGDVISYPVDCNLSIFCACTHGHTDVLKAGRRRVFIVFTRSFGLLLCPGCVRRCP